MPPLRQHNNGFSPAQSTAGFSALAPPGSQETFENTAQSAERGQLTVCGCGQLRKAGRVQSSSPNSVVHIPWVRDREKNTPELKTKPIAMSAASVGKCCFSIYSLNSHFHPAVCNLLNHKGRSTAAEGSTMEMPTTSASLDGMCKWTGQAPVISNCGFAFLT